MHAGRRSLTTSLVALAALAAPALAQPGPGGLQLAGIVMDGLYDGGKSMMVANQLGTLVATGNGIYELDVPAGKMVASVASPSECVFTISLTWDGVPQVTTLLDMNKVESLEVVDKGPYEELNLIETKIAGAGSVQFYQDGAWFDSQLGGLSFPTDLTADQVRTMAEALKTICP